MDNKSQELFDVIKLIASKEIEKQNTTDTIIGTVIERVSSSDAYKVSYQNIEIIASSIGGLYKAGDSVYVLLPKGLLSDVKFIIGKTNDRVPTITSTSSGLSESTLQNIQDIINDLNDWTSDNIVSPLEKQSLAIQWEQIKKSYNDAIAEALEYDDVISTFELTDRYKELEGMMLPILSNMESSSEVNGQLLRDTVGAYLAEDSRIRILVQAEIKKELVYKVNIVSSNGNSFKNGAIDTTLSVLAMRGRNNITSTLLDADIRWYRLDGDGNEVVGSEKIGKTIKVTSSDVDVKGLFLVKIVIDNTIVAQDIITIVDLNDIENIELSVAVKLNKNQVYNPTSKTIIPDYEKDSQVITAQTKKALKDVTNASTFSWYDDGVAIVSDGRFLVEGNKLTILRNLTSSDKPVRKILCVAEYYSDEYKMNLINEELLEFSFISDGEQGEDGKNAFNLTILFPYGNIIENGNQAFLLASLEANLAETNITNRIENRKWFYEDEMVVSSSPFYDADGGVGWSLIGDDNNYNGGIQGYKTNILSASNKSVIGTLSIKSVAFFEDYKAASTATFLNYDSPISVAIVGNPTLKNGDSTTLSVEAYLGSDKIVDTTKYTFMWTLELVDNSARVFGPQLPISRALWPKYGERVTLEWGDIPDNKNVYLQCKVFKND